MTHVPNYIAIRNNLQVRELFQKRMLLLRKIREFFWEREFVETDTPMLVNLPGMEPYLDVFQTRFVPVTGAKRDMYLITSPEYAMKKLLVAGLLKIFQITRSFRNKETGGALHNPEFTILEWYRAESDYTAIMRDCEEMIRYLCRQLFHEEKFVYQGNPIDVSGDFERITVQQAFEKYAGISRENFEDPVKLIHAAREKGYLAENFDDAFFLIFLNEIEGKLGRNRPTILYEYPVSMAALSRACPDSRYSERFEIYIAGIELANAFSELTDPDEQLRRLRDEREQRKQLGKTVYDVDMSFIEALKMGCPASGGIALGVDRLVMLLLDKPSIEDVIFFPFRDL